MIGSSAALLDPLNLDSSTSVISGWVTELSSPSLSLSLGCLTPSEEHFRIASQGGAISVDPYDSKLVILSNMECRGNPSAVGVVNAEISILFSSMGLLQPLLSAVLQAIRSKLAYLGEVTLCDLVDKMTYMMILALKLVRKYILVVAEMIFNHFLFN